MNKRIAAATAFVIVASLFGVPLTAETAAERRASINAPIIGIIGAGLDGQMTRMLWQIANVTDSPEMRVLPVLGKGSINNVADLLYLRGIDGALLQSDALNFIDKLGIESDLSSKIAYIAPLGRQMAHLLARDSIKSIRDLEGKNVNFGKTTSGSVVSATQIFDFLSVNVVVTNTGHRKALKALKAGEIEAMFWMTPPPAELLTFVKPDDGLHLLPIPLDELNSDIYNSGVIESGTYPFETADVETVSTLTVLAAYNWPKDHPRRANVDRFAAALRNNFDELRGDDFHASFQTVDPDEPVPGGWRRF